MIATLTPNPAVDQTVCLPRLEVGSINRFQTFHLDPAGKGINVSRMAHRLGWPTMAFGFLAGDIGRFAEHALDDEGVPHHFVRVPGQTRLNVTVLDRASGTATSLFGPGPPIEEARLAQLEEVMSFWLQTGRILVVAGRLPPNVRPNFYASYVRLAASMGVRTILDAEGEPLHLGMLARPFLIKPNVAEAEGLLGRALPDLKAVCQAVIELRQRGIEVVVISMGADGAVCGCGERVWRAVPPKVDRRSTVGSGDSLVAGLAVAIARGDEVLEGLRLGTAAGAATAAALGTAMGSAEEVAALLPRVQIEEVT